MLVEFLWSESDTAQLERFGHAVADNEPAAALLALEGADEQAQAKCQAALDEWAAETRHWAPTAGAARGAEALRRVLAQRGGFGGDTNDYYNPLNTQLSRVIERRRGMPIMLSVVWIEVGRRAGLTMDGVGMPGHFIARVGGDAGLLVDPFSGGFHVTVRQCAAIVDELSNTTLPWTDKYLEPVSCDAIVERVIRNQLRVHQSSGDTRLLFRVARFHAALRPDAPEPQLLHACIAERAGAFALACRLYRDVTARFAGTKEARVASRRHDGARRRASMTH